MLTAFTWWFTLSVIGWVSWPLTAPFFRHSPLRGFAYSRVLGLVLLAYPVWLLTVAKIVPFSRSTTLIAALALASIGLGLAWFQRRNLAILLKSKWQTICILESSFLIIFLLLYIYKAFTPDIQHTEQPMDLMFLTSLLRSTKIPPPDPWLSGYAVSYYYGGYFSIAQLAQILRTAAGSAYNLGLVSSYALAFFTAGGVFWDVIAESGNRSSVWRTAIWVMAGVAGILLASNLAGVVTALEHVLQVSQTTWLQALGGSSATIREPWWWWAGRAFTDRNYFGRLTEIISEFPAFSFLLGDLHPHLMALPFVLFAIGVAVEIVNSDSEESWWVIPIYYVSPLVFGILGWINSWDLPTFGMLVWLAYLVNRLKNRTFSALLPDAVSYTIYLGLSLVLFIPFYSTLTTQVLGIGVTYYVKTGLGQLLLTFGLPLLPLALYVLKRANWHRLKTTMFWWASILLLPWLVTVLVGGIGRSLLGLGILWVKGPWVILILGTLLALLADGLSHTKLNDYTLADKCVYLSGFMGCGLLYIAEFLYIADVFNSRMNTYFKLSYQAWILLSFAGFLAVWQLMQRAKANKWVAPVGVALLVLACLYAPLTAFSNTYGSKFSPGVDGIAYLKSTAPDVYGTITWLQLNAPAGSTLVEGVGEDYTQGNRVSAFSGVPTLLGWPGHERQWRGSGDIVRERREVINRIYSSKDSQEVMTLLQANHVAYLFVSPREMAIYQFGAERLAWYGTFLEPVYTAHETYLYQAP
ncbi:MAG: DUF2298 domain-containing protein [Anaerolineae bacterium]